MKSQPADHVERGEGVGSGGRPFDLMSLPHFKFLSVMVTGPLRKQVFSKEGTFGPSFGELPMGKTSKSVLRPAESRLEANFDAFPIRIPPKLCPKVLSLPAFLGVRFP